MDEIPEAMKSVYSMDAFNDRVELYVGPGTVTDSLGHTSEGELTLALEWLPSPRVAFDLRAQRTSGIEISTPAELKLDDSRELSGLFAGIQTTSGKPGAITEHVRGLAYGEFGPTEAISHVEFNLANFPEFFGSSIGFETASGPRWWRGRSSWTSDEWKLTLDMLDEATSLRSSPEYPERTGGYALTHVGRVERANGASIAPNDLSAITSALSGFFTFVAGTPNSVVLPRGIGVSGAIAWESWRPPNTESWHARISCFPDNVVEDKKVRAPRLDPLFSR